MPSPRLAVPASNATLSLPDGDQVSTTWIEGSGRVVVYLFHGLGGSSESGYMRRTALICARLGLPAVLLNHRGSGLGRGLASKPYHSGSAEDLSAVIAEGRRRYPERTHLAVGFSLSANALLLLLSRRRGTTLPDMAIAVNAPINLSGTAEALVRGFNRVYDVRFYRDCRRIADPSARLPWLATLAEFDRLYTAPRAGFASREEYYATCSTRDLLADISTPTVVLMSQDDPFIDFSDYARARLSPQLHLHVERTGGHMGYLTAQTTPLGTRRWLDYALAHFIERMTGFSQNSS